MPALHRLEKPVFKERLREERHRRDLTQQELTTLCNFSVNQIGRYESGEREPTTWALYALAHALGVSADYLIGLTDDRNEIMPADSVERELIETYHEAGWPGVIRLGAERIAK